MKVKVVVLMLVSVIGVMAQATMWKTTNPSYSSWDDPTSWTGDVKPAEDGKAEIRWEKDAPPSPYYVSLGASQTIDEFALSEWNNPPSPLYIGTDEDVARGHTLTLNKVTRPTNMSGNCIILADVILSADAVVSIEKGWNGGLEFRGVISGPYGLTQTRKTTENGTLIFTAHNTYTGPTVFSSGTIQFGDGGANAGSVAGDIENNASLVVNVPRKDKTVLHEVTGTGSIQKTGTGTLVFAGVNSLSSTGKFEVKQGFFDCTTPGGGILNFGSYSLSGDFTYIGTEDLDFGVGPVDLGGSDRAITVGNGMLTIGGVVSGSRAVRKQGAGTLKLTGVNAYTKTTAANAGVLLLAGDGTIGADGLTVGADGAVVLDNAEKNANRIPDAKTVSVGGQLTLEGNAVEETVETAGALTLATGAARISVEPSGETPASLVFASLASRAAGNTTIFDIPANASVGFTTAPEAIPGALVTSGTGYALAGISEEGLVVPLVADGEANLLYDLTGDISVDAATLSSVEFRNNSGSPVTVTLTGALATANGILFSGDSPITITGGSIAGASGEAILLSGNMAGVTVETPVSADNITYGGTGDFVISGNQTAKAYAEGYITLNTKGYVTWAQKNNNCGALRLYAGCISMATGAKLYEKDSVSSGTRCYFNVGVNAIFDLNGVSAQVNGLSGAGVVTNSSDTKATLTCKWSPSGSNWQDFAPNFSGALGGNMTLTLTSDGYYADRFKPQLSGAASNEGGITMGSSLTLSVLSETALGAGPFTVNSGNVVISGPNLSLEGNPTAYWKSYSFSGGDLDFGSGLVTLNNTAVTLTVANSLTIGDVGEVTAGSTLTKAGTGTLVLNGDAFYTGATTVSAGTLRLGGAVASQELSVASGATLAFVSATELHKKASISIEEGGTLNLKNLNPIQVKRMFVAGVELTETGTYGAVGSGARHELACISGWGVLKVGGSGMMVIIK